MATILSTDFLANFGGLFTFLFVFVIVFAILEYKKIIGENKGIHAIAAFSIAMLVTISGDAREVITFAAPWFVVLMTVIILILLAFSIFDLGPLDFKKIITEGEYSSVISYWIIILASVIVLISLANVLGPKFLAQNTDIVDGSTVTLSNNTGTGTSDFQANTINTIFSTKVMGLLMLLVIGSFTIKFLSQEK